MRLGGHCSAYLVLLNRKGFLHNGPSFSRNLSSKFCATVVFQLRKHSHQLTVVAAIIRCSATVLEVFGSIPGWCALVFFSFPFSYRSNAMAAPKIILRCNDVNNIYYYNNTAHKVHI